MIVQEFITATEMAYALDQIFASVTMDGADISVLMHYAGLFCFQSLNKTCVSFNHKFLTKSANNYVTSPSKNLKKKHKRAKVYNWIGSQTNVFRLQI